MFCPNCGANLSDGSAFCGNCGANLQKKQEQQAPVQQPVYQAPQQPVYQAPQQPAYQPQPTYQRPPQPVYRAPMSVSKKEYLAKHADASTKSKATLVTITFILSLILIVASVIAPLAMPFYDIPAINLLLTVAEADPDELMDEVEVTFEELEEDYDLQKETMDRDERDAVKQVLEKMEALTDNFSVLNFTALVSTFEKAGDDYVDSSDMAEITQINQVMTIIIVALIGAFLLPALFALLGGLNKSTALTITALIFTVLSQLSLCGVLFVVLSLVIFIVQAVLCSGINKNYESFRTGRPM